MTDAYEEPDRGDAGDVTPDVDEGLSPDEPDTAPAPPDEEETEEHDTLDDDDEVEPEPAPIEAPPPPDNPAVLPEYESDPQEALGKEQGA